MPAKKSGPNGKKKKNLNSSKIVATKTVRHLKINPTISI